MEEVFYDSNGKIIRRTDDNLIYFGLLKAPSFIAAGTYQSGLIDTWGRLYTWGEDTSVGALGQNTTDNSVCVPTLIYGSYDYQFFTKLYTGNATFYAIDKNGESWSWGDNVSGQLGINSTTNKCTPIKIYGNHNFVTMSGTHGDGSEPGFALAIDNNGQGWSWGSNINGYLGNNGTLVPSTPASIWGAHVFTKIEAGDRHSLAIDISGRTWTWGFNSVGQLGDNSITQRNTPVALFGTKTFCHISAGWRFSNGIDNNGKVWSWGLENAGSLGNGSATSSKRTPVALGGGNKTFCQIASGNAHVAAIDNHGMIWGWGENTYGAIGDNTTTNRCTPVSVAGTRKTFCKVSVGLSWTMAIDNHNNLWTWGYNTGGFLGDGTVISKKTPVKITI